MRADRPTNSTDADAILDLIARIERECPRRQPTSPDELRAQEIMRAIFEKAGLATEYHEFRFNDSLYANLALHFGLGTAGSIVSGVAPALGLLLHGLATASYWGESTRRFYLLRRLLGFKSSQNLLAVLPAQREPALRVVFLAHADAAFTGLLFHPELIKRFATRPPKALEFSKRSLALATRTMGALTVFDALRLAFGPLTLPLRPIEGILSIPAALAFLLAMDMVLRDEIVPGANDNLTGVAVLPFLCDRLRENQRADVEYVFAVTGAEEASLGGADALSRDMEKRWGRERTVIVALDSLSNGELKYVGQEGEVVMIHPTPWLEETAREVAAADERFAEVEGIDVPVGGTDAAPFIYHGWDAICLTCVDPALGAPRHYHQPTDTASNLDMEKVALGLDYTAALTEAIVARRLGANAGKRGQ